MEIEKTAPNDEIDFQNLKTNGNGFGKKTEWTSIYIAAIITFFGAVQYSIYFSSLWPYLQILDKSATEEFFGLIISCYSIGQMIASPLTGFWSNKTRKMRHPLHAGLILMLIGNILYFLTPLMPSKRKYFILIARFVTGCGSANVSLLKSYATSASTGSDRSKAIAYVTGGLALGSVIGPTFQLIFTPIGPKGFQVYQDLWINMYTCPALLASSANIAGMLMLVFLFKESYVDLIDANGTEVVGCNMDRFDWCHTFKPINIHVYYITYVLFIGLCFPNINISLNTLFSKILGPRPQAAQQGWLQVSGAAARMIGPIVISSMYTHHGPKWSWNLEIAVISFTLFLWMILRNRMVPLQVPPEFAEFEEKNDKDVKKPKKLIFPKSEKF
uniref:Major facilitator superfamily (MFS) profile domain-containing protein n=1 Tax=Panagrolaimus sp. JU765 TaxID=591449 RepID=A0AC34Q924_9BILA